MIDRSWLLTLIVLSVLPVGCSGLSVQISANPPPGNAPSSPPPTPLSSIAPSVPPVGAAAMPNAANAQAIDPANTQRSTAPTTPSVNAEMRQHWPGFYRFSETSPPSPSPMVMEYKIRIYEAGDLVLADIDIDGFQTMKRLQADVVPINGNPEEVGLYFKSVREGNTLGSYSPADLLMTLQLVRNGAQTLRVTFAGISPLDPNHRNGWQTSYSFR